MKKQMKWAIPFFSTMLLFMLALIPTKREFESAKIPKKYLIEGEKLETTDEGCFDYYKIANKTNEVAVALKDSVSDSSKINEIPFEVTISKDKYTVTGIWRRGFAGKTLSSNFTLPKTIQIIDYEAFFYTTGLTDFTIPYTVTDIGSGAFYSSSITSVSFDEGNGVGKDIGVCGTSTTNETETTTETEDKKAAKVTTIPELCFENCKKLKTVSFPKSLKVIAGEAFEQCEALVDLYLPSGMESIGKNAFRYCKNLLNVYIPHSLTDEEGKIGDYAFAYCNSACTLHVSSGFKKTLDDGSYRSWQYRWIYKTDQNKKHIINLDATLGSDIEVDQSLWVYDTYNEKTRILKYLGSSNIVAMPNQLGGKNVGYLSSNVFDSDLLTKITAVYLPTTLIEIPDNLFCKAKDIYDNNYSFAEKLRIVDTVNEDGTCYNFNNDPRINLSGITNLETIGAFAFQKDPNKKDSEQQIISTFYESLSLPKNIKDVKQQAFYNLTTVKKFSWGFDGRTTDNTSTLTIGESAFRNLGSAVCESSSDVNSSALKFPTDKITINSHAFRNACCIKEIEFPETETGLLKIENQAFFHCINLETLKIEKRGPDNDEWTPGVVGINLGPQAFANCGAGTDVDSWPYTSSNRDYRTDSGLQNIFIHAYFTANYSGWNNYVFNGNSRAVIYTDQVADDVKFPNFVVLSQEDSSNNVPSWFKNSSEENKTYYKQNVPFYRLVNWKDKVEDWLKNDADKNRHFYNCRNADYLLDKTNNTAILTRYHYEKGLLPSSPVFEPITVNDKVFKVVEIGDNSFSCWGSGADSDQTITLSLPDDITTIGEFAFFKCLNPIKITMTATSKLNRIGYYAFAFSGLQTIENLPKNCTLMFKHEFRNRDGGLSSKYEEVLDRGPSPFLNCPNLEKISVSGSTGKLLVTETEVNYGNSFRYGYVLKSDKDIVVVTPKFHDSKETPTSPSLSFGNFYYGAYRLVDWITDITVSPGNYSCKPKENNPVKQSIFGGMTIKGIHDNFYISGSYSNSSKDPYTYTKANDNLNSVTFAFNNSDKTWTSTKSFNDCSNINTVYFTQKAGAKIPANILSGLENVQYFGVKDENGKVITEANTLGELNLSQTEYVGIEDNAFNGVSNIKSLVLPKTMETLGNSAFIGTSISGTLEIPGSVTSIGENCFSGVTGIDKLTIEDSSENLKIGKSAFSKVSITSLDLSTRTGDVEVSGFDNCSNLSEVKLPSSCTKIGEAAFQNCAALSKIGTSLDGTNTLPDSITEISDDAFNGDTSLTKIVLSNSLASIGTHAFKNTKLTEITIPNTVTVLGYGCFESDNSPGGLKTVTFVNGSKITGIPSNCFTNQWLETISLPDTVSSIGDNAFKNNPLTSFTFENITSIGANAFENTKLKKVELYTINNIGNNAFSNCTELTFVRINKQIKSFNNSMFSGDINLTTIYFDSGASCGGFSDSSFSGLDGLKYVVLPSSFDKSTRIFLRANGSVTACLNQAYSSGTDFSGNWWYTDANRTTQVKIAYSSDLTGKYDTWTLNNDTITINPKGSTSAGDTSNNSSNWIPYFIDKRHQTSC